MTKVRVLIVDDSGFIRRRVRGLLSDDADIEVVGEAENGMDALEQIECLRPDVVTMDIEMPVMDGISAVREIMRRRPTPVIMFSSLTREGAQATLDALEAGAVDFLPKRFADLSSDAATAKHRMQRRIKAIARGRGDRPYRAPTAAVKQGAGDEPMLARKRAREPRLANLSLVVIGASTGGPVALQEILTHLPADFPLPLALVQHMPAQFTKPYAERINGLCSIEVREAADGDQLQPGLALLAPGGKHMTIVRRGSNLIVKLLEPSEEHLYKPSVDITFTSAAQACAGQTLGIILTGMGADGCEGAKHLKQCNATIWAQDEPSSVIYGMPRAVAQAGIADQIMPLKEFAAALRRLR